MEFGMHSFINLYPAFISFINNSTWQTSYFPHNSNSISVGLIENANKGEYL